MSGYFWLFATAVVFLGGMSLWGIVDSWLKYRERRLKLEAKAAANNAAKLAAANAELEARVQVLEKIVTDGGMQTAAQIEALRERPQLQGEKAE